MLGLLGGTFDPVHIGHLRLAIEVREQLRLDEVRLLPAPNPRLRDAPRVDVGIRVRLLRAAIEGVSGLAVDERELTFEGPTRTVDTLRSVRTEVGSRPLCLIIGADAVARLHRWHEWERLLELAHLVVARRPGARLPTRGPVAALIGRCLDERPEALAAQAAGVVRICDVPGLSVSATAVRERLAQGRSVDYLVPDGALQLLKEEHLYA